MLAELYSYANPDDGEPPADSDLVMITYKYLDACNKLFEGGLLNSKAQIRDMASPIIQNIRDGFQFYRDWNIQLARECKLLINQL